MGTASFAAAKNLAPVATRSGDDRDPFFRASSSVRPLRRGRPAQRLGSVLAVSSDVLARWSPPKPFVCLPRHQAVPVPLHLAAATKPTAEFITTAPQEGFRTVDTFSRILLARLYNLEIRNLTEPAVALILDLARKLFVHACAAPELGEARASWLCAFISVPDPVDRRD